MRVKLSIAIINIKTSIEIQWSLRVQGFSWCFLECLGYWWNSLGSLVSLEPEAIGGLVMLWGFGWSILLHGDALRTAWAKCEALGQSRVKKTLLFFTLL
jgi:hypothetical protein